MGLTGKESDFTRKPSFLFQEPSREKISIVQVTSVKRNYVEAKLLEVNKKSKFRVVPDCTIYNECGGCQIMHLHYDKQLNSRQIFFIKL